MQNSGFPLFCIACSELRTGNAKNRKCPNQLFFWELRPFSFFYNKIESLHVACSELRTGNVKTFGFGHAMFSKFGFHKTIGTKRSLHENRKTFIFSRGHGNMKISNAHVRLMQCSQENTRNHKDTKELTWKLEPFIFFTGRGREKYEGFQCSCKTHATPREE